jgi:HEAT repeat protein
MNSAPKIPARASRRSVITLTLAAALLCAAAGLIVWKSRNHETPPASSAPEADSAQVHPATRTDEELPQLVEHPSETALSEGKSSVATLRARQSPPGAGSVPVPRPEPSPVSRQLINNLFHLDQPGLPQTKQQVAEWKANLQQLIQQGAGAVPAIQEFLEKNVDLGFGREGSQTLGYSSARAALFDALAQIGGAEAIGLLSQTLQATGDPREIALLARSLEQLEPQQHQQEALEAVRQVLAMTANGKMDETEVGPLFEVLQKYAGPGAVAELEQATGRWNYYAAIALGQLPDGAGVPSLIQMVQDANGKSKSLAALEMLAQVSIQYPDARAALVQQVRSDKIGPNIWPYLASVLAGDQMQLREWSLDAAAAPSVREMRTFHIVSGNQNFYSAPPAALSPDQISQQIALIDELIASTSNPIGLQTLQNARGSLARRLPQTGAGN